MLLSTLDPLSVGCVLCACCKVDSFRSQQDSRRRLSQLTARLFLLQRVTSFSAAGRSLCCDLGTQSVFGCCGGHPGRKRKARITSHKPVRAVLFIFIFTRQDRDPGHLLAATCSSHVRHHPLRHSSRHIQQGCTQAGTESSALAAMSAAILLFAAIAIAPTYLNV